MSTELTELEIVKAQLKEQTQQMEEMASTMKSMMGQAMPLLEEQTRKLRKEKEARKKEERVREKQCPTMVPISRKVQKIWRPAGKHQAIWKPAGEGAQCRRCKEYISPSSVYFIGHFVEIKCTACTLSYNMLKQQPANELEKSGMEDFLIKLEYANGTLEQYMWIWKDTHFIRVLRQDIPAKQNNPDSIPE
jgi:hypothetical protein